jgi:hypothetical protein
MTVGDDTCTDPGDLRAERSTANSALLLVPDPAAGGTGLILFPRTDCLPAAWVGPEPTELVTDFWAAAYAAIDT